MFGSYPYPPTIIVTPITEVVAHLRKPGKLVVNKEAKSRSKITKEDWVKWAVNVWRFSIAISNPHPAPFPAELPKRCVTFWSCKDDLIFDPFMGSGTTAIAADRLGRNFFGCDINAGYVKMALNRLEEDRQKRAQLEMNL